MLESFFQCCVVKNGNVASHDSGDIAVNFVAAPAQFGNAYHRVGFAALAHLLEQLEQRQQARLGSDKVPLRERAEPGDRLLGGGHQIELWLVCARGVELAHPPFVVGGPVVQILERRFGKGVCADPLAQTEQFVFERFGQVSLSHYAHVGSNEYAVQKGGDQDGIVRAQEAPRRMVLP